MGRTVRTSVLHYGGAVVFTALAVLLRWLLDPVMGEHWATVTLYGAVAAAVWYGGYRPALVATVLGYLACNYLFMEPRGYIALRHFYSFIGLALYLFACSLIIGFGEALRAAQRSTREGQERLRTTLASIGDAVISTDTEGRITMMNAVAESLTGWKKEEAIGQQLEIVFRIVNEETRQLVHNPAKKAMSEGVIVGLANHTILIAKGGNELPIEDSAAPIRCARGEVVGCVLVFRDVTERRRAERSARFLASIVESSDDAIIGKDVNGIITSWNEGAERIFGYKASEAVGHTISMLAPPDQADEMPGILQRIKRGERVHHFDSLRRAKDGRLIPVSLTISPIKDEDGRIIGASKIARDVSERNRAEQAARSATQQLQTVTESLSITVARCSHDYKYLWVNKACAEFLGLQPEVIVGRPIIEILGPSVFEQLRPHFEKVLRGERTSYEREAGYGGIGRRWIHAVYSPTFDAEGKADGWVAVSLDITQRKQAEEALRQSEQRLAAELDAKSLLHALSTRLLSATNLGAALDDVLENAIKISGADFGNIQLFNPHEKALEISAQQGFQQDFLNYFRSVQVDDGSACAIAMQTGRRTIVEDVELDPT